MHSANSVHTMLWQNTRFPAEAAHFSLEKNTSSGELHCVALLCLDVLMIGD